MTSRRVLMVGACRHVSSGMDQTAAARFEGLVYGCRGGSAQEGEAGRRMSTTEALLALDRFAHAVADTPHRADETRLLGVISQFAPEIGDVDRDDVIVPVLRRPPHSVEELATTEDDPRLGGQRFEEIELKLGQLHDLPVQPHLASTRIDDQWTEAALSGGRLLVRRTRPAEHGLDTGDELPR